MVVDHNHLFTVIIYSFTSRPSLIMYKKNVDFFGIFIAKKVFSKGTKSTLYPISSSSKIYGILKFIFLCTLVRFHHK